MGEPSARAAPSHLLARSPALDPRAAEAFARTCGVSGLCPLPAAAMLMTLYSTFMKRNSVYVGVVLGGALVGQTAVSSAFDSAWRTVNAGKLYEDIPTLGKYVLTALSLFRGRMST